MIDRSQLAEALGRLDPRDREVLDYSLRRHVPDNDLAAVFGCGAGDVARMRAAAVERLADDLGVQRGADLGHVLTALLDSATWDALPAAARPAGGDADGAPGSDAADTGTRPAGAAEDPGATTSPTGAAGAGAVPAQGAGAPPAPQPAAAPQSPRAEDGTPVLGMLAGEQRDLPYERQPGSVRDRDRAPDGADRAPARQRWVAAALAIVVLAAAGLGSVLLLGGGGGSTSDAAGGIGGGPRPFVPQDKPGGAPFPAEPPEETPGYPTATIERRTVLRDAAGGRPLAKLAPRTEWDSPRVLSIVDRDGDWLGVLAPELENGVVGWMREDDAATIGRVDWAVRANLAQRKVIVERGGETVREIDVGIGRPDHPTPTGRFAVTDKLRVTDPGSPYGCCVVALTGHQTELPLGWPGGDRLAIHATPDTSGIGGEVSLGCMRAAPKDARWLMDVLPLGTPVFVRAGTADPAPKRKRTSRRKPPRR